MPDRMTIIGRKPTHPGEMLREEFMPDFGLSVAQLASKIGVSRQAVNQLVSERSSLSPSMALRLARLFGTSPQYWLNMQRNVDIWDSFDSDQDSIDSIEPLCVRGTVLSTQLTAPTAS